MTGAATEQHLATRPGPVELGGELVGALLGVVFPKTTARAYPVMLAIAGRALRHRQSVDDGKVYHLVVFARSGTAARDAIDLLTYARNLSGVRVFADGHPFRNAIRVVEVLECYANAEACSAPAAWCQPVTRAPYHEDRPAGPLSVSFSATAAPRPARPLWLFPCRFLFDHGFQADPRHPASNVEQIEAGGIRVGCHWCPRFKPAGLCVLKE